MGVAAAHCKLDSMVANFMKVLCSQEIYRYVSIIPNCIVVDMRYLAAIVLNRYALMEMGHDNPDCPMGMLSELHLKRCK